MLEVTEAINQSIWSHQIFLPYTKSGQVWKNLVIIVLWKALTQIYAGISRLFSDMHGHIAEWKF